MPKCPVAASPQDQLPALGGFLQDFRHQIDTAFVGIDRGTAEDARTRHDLLQPPVGKGTADQDPQLFLRSRRRRSASLAQAYARDGGTTKPLIRKQLAD